MREISWVWGKRWRAPQQICDKGRKGTKREGERGGGGRLVREIEEDDVANASVREGDGEPVL